MYESRKTERKYRCCLVGGGGLPSSTGVFRGRAAQLKKAAKDADTHRSRRWKSLASSVRQNFWQYLAETLSSSSLMRRARYHCRTCTCLAKYISAHLAEAGFFAPQVTSDNTTYSVV